MEHNTIVRMGPAESPFIHSPLGDTPAQVLRTALADLEAAEASNSLAINMGVWMNPTVGQCKCVVCFAGACMVGTLRIVPVGKVYSVSEVVKDRIVIDQLEWLDAVRCLLESDYLDPNSSTMSIVCSTVRDKLDKSLPGMGWDQLLRAMRRWMGQRLKQHGWGQWDSSDSYARKPMLFKENVRSLIEYLEATA